MKPPIKKERIFRALVSGETTVSGIARRSNLAKSYVSRVVKELEDTKIVWGTEKLHADHENLMREWGNLKRNIFQSIKPLMIDMLMPERIKGVVKNYAVSGPFGEMLVQGESPGKPVVIYIEECELEKKKKELIKLGSVGKGQVWVYAYDADVFSGRWDVKGWKVVSMPQLCADLIALGTYADLGIKLFKRWLDVGR